MISQLAIRAFSSRFVKFALAVAVLTCIALVLRLTVQTCSERACAAHGRTIITETDIEILDEVRFVGTDTIAPSSLHTLDAVAATLIANPDIGLVEVQANTEARARACVDYMIGQGVPAARLTTGLTDRPTAVFLIVERHSQP